MMLAGHILQKHAKTGGSPVDEGLIVCLLVCSQEKLKGGVEGVAPELMNQGYLQRHTGPTGAGAAWACTLGLRLGQ